MSFMLKRCLLALVMAALVAVTNAADTRDDIADTRWLIEVLELRPGSIVAEIGAGSGELTIAVARHVTGTGHVYTSELGDERLDHLRNAVRSSAVTNVTVVEGEANRTKLPGQCCEALFMRAVYHHFANPAAMNASLWQSLKPGGRVAVIDFEPRGSESRKPSGRASGDEHGVTAETVSSELARAGFEVISAEQRSGGGTYVVAVRPAAP